MLNYRTLDQLDGILDGYFSGMGDLAGVKKLKKKVKKLAKKALPVVAAVSAVSTGGATAALAAGAKKAAAKKLLKTAAKKGLKKIKTKAAARIQAKFAKMSKKAKKSLAKRGITADVAQAATDVTSEALQNAQASGDPVAIRSAMIADTAAQAIANGVQSGAIQSGASVQDAQTAIAKDVLARGGIDPDSAESDKAAEVMVSAAGGTSTRNLLLIGGAVVGVGAIAWAMSRRR